MVDRDSDIRSVIDELLMDYGFEVHQAANSHEAFLQLRQRSYHALLCHVELLKSDEGRLHRLCREVHQRMRIVAMSASGAVELNGEADEKLAKPFSRAQLLDVLGRDYSDPD